MATTVVLVMVSATAAAQGQYSLQPDLSRNVLPDDLLGIWGTASQCAAHKSGDHDNPALLPYQISHDWIRQGFLYCYLSLYEHKYDGNSIEAFALAQCGEDNLRDYRLNLKLLNGKLRISWSQDFTTQALMTCE